MDYEEYKSVLEYVPSNNSHLKDNILDDNSILFNTMKKYAVYDKYVVSLSGGVDSMVLISILNYLNKTVIGIHINYNNRPETYIEREFLEKWCEYNDIQLYCMDITDIQRGDSKRSEYEEYTKKLRFNMYKQVLDTENCDSVLLAHHKDDIVENIFTNICRARSLFNLGVLQKESVIDNVTIERPLLDLYKKCIVEYANTHEIPYFKDTTPKWSVRGCYREKIDPSVQYAYGNQVKDNLLSVETELKEWYSLITDSIINPFVKSMSIIDTEVSFNITYYKQYPLCFWNTIFIKLFHFYHSRVPSKRSIKAFVDYIEHRTDGTINLTNETKTKMKNNVVTISFKV